MELKAVFYLAFGSSAVGLFLAWIRESMGKDSPFGIGLLPAWVYRIPAALVSLSMFCGMCYLFTT